MKNKRNQDRTLWVRAIGLIREIDIQTGMPLANSMRFVGRNANGEELAGGHVIPYHSVYISHLMDGTLLPMDTETAIAAGVPFRLC